MKTLDEVIDSITKQSALEIRDIKKPDKDRFWVDRETYNDALYYLKEYRSEKQIWESDRKHYENWMKQYKEARDKHQQAVTEMLKNPPLTMEDLKEMIGQPVWDVSGQKWWLVKGYTVCDIIGKVLLLDADENGYSTTAEGLIHYPLYRMKVNA